MTIAKTVCMLISLELANKNTFAAPISSTGADGGRARPAKAVLNILNGEAPAI